MEKNSTLKHLAAFYISEKRAIDLSGLNSPGITEPSPDILRNILNYSKALEVKKTKKSGFLEFVLN